MKYFDMLKFNGELMSRLHRSGARMEDYKYIPLYEEFRSRQASGEKISYVVMCLAKEYGISERLVYYIIHRFGEEVTASEVQYLPPPK